MNTEPTQIDAFPQIPSKKKPHVFRVAVYKKPEDAMCKKNVNHIQVSCCTVCKAAQNYHHPIQDFMVNLTLHFVNGNPKDLTRDNVLFLCQRCLSVATKKKV
jgi:hypothetical protein